MSLHVANTGPSKLISPTISQDSSFSSSYIHKTMPESTDDRTITDDATKKISIARIVGISLLIALGGLIFGYDIGSTGGLFEMPMYAQAVGDYDLQNKAWIIPSWRSGLIMGGTTLGGLFGSLGFGKVAESFGRRWAMIYCALLLTLAAAAHAIFRNFWPVLFVARFFTGISVGGLSAVCPMYLSETAPTQLRAVLISSFQLLITVGILIAQLVSFGCSFWAGNIGQFLIPLLAVCFLSIPMILAGFFFLPESARYLVARGESEKAVISLSQVMGLPSNSIPVQNELADIERSVESDLSAGASSWKELFSKKDRILYRVVLSIGIMMLQQLTGINYFFFYGTSLFKEISTLNPFITPLILGSVNVLGTIACLPVIAKFPRRVVLMTGSFVMFVAFIIFTCLGSFSLYTGVNGAVNPNVGILMIVVTCVFIIGFAGTWAPVSFLVVSEMFPQRLRSKAISLAVAASWLTNTAITFISPVATKAIGYKYGFVFSFFTLVSGIVVYFFVFETRGRSLEEIEEMITFGVTARASPKWEPSGRKQEV